MAGVSIARGRYGLPRVCEELAGMVRPSFGAPTLPRPEIEYAAEDLCRQVLGLRRHVPATHDTHLAQGGRPFGGWP